MSKRASVGGKASPAKVARRSPAKSPAKAVDPSIEACRSVCKALKSHSEASTAEVLCSALPLALKVPDASQSRHDFQERMLNAVAKELATQISVQKAAVLALEQEAASLDTEKSQSETIAEEIASRLASKKNECEATEEAVKVQQEILKAAQATLKAAKKSAEAADGDRQELEKNRDDFASGLTGLWEPLKAAEFQKSWRERNKKIVQLVEKFKAIGVEESLLEAIQAALKLKADLRGEFAAATVSHAEEVYTKHVEALKLKVEAFGAEISARATAVTEAEANAKKEQEALDAAMEASIASQNAWGAETEVEAAHKDKMQAYEPTVKELQKKLAATRSEATHLEEVSTSFEAVRSNKPLEQAGDTKEAAPEAGEPQADTV